MSVAILGGVDRGGTWVVPPRHSVVAVLGGVQLDLREARFSQREVTIDVFTLMGGVDIMVGDDVDVDVSGFGIMGGFDHRASGPGLPGAPKVRVVGLALMGGVNVRRGQPGQGQDNRDHHHDHHHRDHLRDHHHREIGRAADGDQPPGTSPHM
jgi:Cell wall-active antibiotics response 4TMS YvqF